MRGDLFLKPSNNHVEFFEEGEAYYQRFINLIENAQATIHLQTYIFEMDRFGSQIQTILVSAAKRGVKVYLLVDRFGSMNLASDFMNKLVTSGVSFYRFNGFQFRWLGQWGRRLHHKILLVDGTKAFVGGINVLSCSFGITTAVPQLDFAVYLEGPITKDLTSYCQQIYSRASRREVSFDPNSDSTRSIGDQKIKLKISINDWFSRRRQIAKQYLWLIRHAKKDIVIINSYFFPRRKFLRQLKLAVKRGVRVRLILPKYLDWPSYVLASQYLYSYLFKNGIEIYEWKKSILHGKLATFDNQASTLGSFNLNYTSYQQNLEMNVDILSQEFTEDLNQKIEYWIASGCERVLEKKFIANASLLTKILRFSYYHLLSFVSSFSVRLAFQETKARKAKINLEN